VAPSKKTAEGEILRAGRRDLGAEAGHSRKKSGDLQVERKREALQRRMITHREPIPVRLKHQVNFRDQRRCVHVNAAGVRCNQTRWLEIHHVKPVGKGGENTLENLTTLCSVHHKYLHSSDRVRRPRSS
jgi:hypothetical protein